MHDDTWTDALARFRDYLTGTGRSATYADRLVALLRQLARLHPDGPTSIDQDAVAAWIDAKSNGRPQTRRNVRSAAGLFFDWMVDTGQRPTSPVDGIPIPRAAAAPAPLLEEYREWITGKGMSANTIRARMKFARLALEQWPGELWEQTPARLAVWLQQYDGWTRATYQGHATNLFLWLVESGRLEVSPLDGMRRGRLPRPRPRPLSDAERDRVLAAASGRLRALLMLGFYAGLRSHEIAKIRGEDVTESTIAVVGKGGLSATVPTHPLLWELAQEYPRSGPWFPSPVRSCQHISSALVGSSVASHFRALGIPDGSIHRARATYATNLMRAGVNLRIVQDLLRHESLATTQRYLGVSDDERMDAIMRLGGVA